MDFINFDYKSYQIRHANASNNEEKAAINLELKELYNSLTIEDKIVFDNGLDAFLIKEKNNLYSQYQAITKEN